MNPLSGLNDCIGEFVNRVENIRLRPGTGYYSALFRGSLFGLNHADDVARQLKTRKADVLWLGANPNVPDSLAHILRPPKDEGHYPDFELQRRSGLYASARWQAGVASPDWSPLENPTGGWTVYRDALAAVGSLDGVAMANILPWGSSRARDFLEVLAGLDRHLLSRCLEFADGLNCDAIKVLSPGLLLVPFSFGRNPGLDRHWQSGVALAAAQDTREHTVPRTSATFKFYTGWCRRGRHDLRTIYLRHPSSLRLAAGDKRRVIETVARVILDRD